MCRASPTFPRTPHPFLEKSYGHPVNTLSCEECPSINFPIKKHTAPKNWGDGFTRRYFPNYYTSTPNIRLQEIAQCSKIKQPMREDITSVLVVVKLQIPKNCNNSYKQYRSKAFRWPSLLFYNK